MKEFDENISELVVLPPVDYDVHTGVEDQEEMGKVGEDGAPEVYISNYNQSKKTISHHFGHSVETLP